MLKVLLAGAAALAPLVVAPANAQAPGETTAIYGELDCDRACLIGVLKQYVDALRHATPSAVPLADDYTFTENNVELAIGKGVWGTIDSLDATGLEVADAETMNAAWFGGMVENGKPGIFTVRIHVTDGKIDEVETVVLRGPKLPGPFGNTVNMIHDPQFATVLPPEQRRPRARMRAIADSYFDTVELNDGQVFAPFSDDCGRLENGISTTSRKRDGVQGEFTPVDGCEAQFKLGIYRINKRIRERQYSIIDEERGVVVATGFFDHANEWNKYNLTSGREMRTALNWPNSISLLEAFRITDAKISRIEAVFTYVPYFMHNPFVPQAAATVPISVSTPAQCNEKCLSGLAGQVMASYPKRGSWRTLPWADEVGYDENSVGMNVDEGLWRAITAVDKTPLVIADETLGRALWVGRIEENGQPSWGAFTVTADGARIGRVEAVVRRKEYLAPYAEPTTAPSFSVLPAARRTERMTMLGAVDRFYAALNANNGTAPADLADKCTWTLNGVLTPAACAMPFANRQFQSLEHVRDIEVIAVDEARGLVAVSQFEDFPATQQEFTDASGGTYKDHEAYPRTQQVVELFRFVNGKIEAVHAITSELPYGMKPR
jgi:hypothetical protein